MGLANHLNQAQCGRPYYLSTSDPQQAIWTDPAIEGYPDATTQMGQSAAPLLTVTNLSGDDVCLTLGGAGKEVMRVTRTGVLGFDTQSGTSIGPPIKVLDITWDATKGMWTGTNSDWSHVGSEYDSGAVVSFDRYVVYTNVNGTIGRRIVNRIYSGTFDAPTSPYFFVGDVGSFYGSYFGMTRLVWLYDQLGPPDPADYPLARTAYGPLADHWSKFPSFFWRQPRKWQVDFGGDAITTTDGTSTFNYAGPWTIETQWTGIASDCTAGTPPYCDNNVAQYDYPLAGDNLIFTGGKKSLQSDCYCAREGELMKVARPNVGGSGFAGGIVFTVGPGRLGGEHNSLGYFTNVDEDRYGVSTADLDIPAFPQGGYKGYGEWLVYAPDTITYRYLTD